jgi:uncharacterized membrane protein YqiK
VDWLVLEPAIWLVLEPAIVLVIVLVIVVVIVVVKVVTVLWARAGMVIARPTRTTVAVSATKRDHLAPTRERLTSLALLVAFIARLP